MQLRYRTIKDPPVSGRLTLKQAEQAVHAVQEREVLKSSKPKLQNRNRRTSASITRKTAARETKPNKKA